MSSSPAETFPGAPDFPDSPPVLLLVDVQRGFDRTEHWGDRNNPDAEARIAELLQAWRKATWPVIHVQHHSREPQSPLRPGQPGVEFKEEAIPLPGERVVQKEVNSAFIGTDLEDHLRDRGIDTLVIAGLTTDHCVSTTARMAGNLGFRTLVISDATATFGKRGPDGTGFAADLIHETALASLQGEFARIVVSSELLGPSGPLSPSVGQGKRR